MPYAEISPAQLLRKLGTHDAPTIFDLCLPEDHALDPYVIPTACRLSHLDIPEVDGPVVCVCQRGKKISHGAAALLRARGIPAQALSGGMIAWREAGLPAIPSAILPKSGTPWVTRHRPRIDRLAVPWLVRRFIDPAAPNLYVPPAEVMGVADRFGAIPFDHPEADLRDSDGRCTFDAVAERFGLLHDALSDMATVIRAADGYGEADEAAGLHAISVGLARSHADDTDLLHAALPIYDALYRWARDGKDERHAH